MSRDEAISRIRNPELDQHFLECEFEYIANKLDITVDELTTIFKGKNKSSYDYKNKRSLIDVASKITSMIGIEKRLYK
jgi:hypothetical protein